jgi:acetylornithine deacetylase/succinyl-diaminopimelate desuccinylase-like protein
MRTAIAYLLISLTAAGAFAQGTIDWKKQEPEILRHYRALIQIDTSSPPGNETKADEYLKKVLEAEGIPTKTFAKEPGRANLVARLKGTGKKRPLLLMAHTDVVPVQREKWPVDPFGAILKDGYVWGRGSRDDKDKLAANLMVMLLAKRSGKPLDRDLIFLAESGEEADPTGVGIAWMVANHFDEIEAEFAITEGGGATSDNNGKVSIVTVGTTEKVPRRARLIATGISGHGSVPRIDNPLIHLSQALAKVGTWETPMRLNDTTRAYFEKVAGMSAPEEATRLNSLLTANPPESVQQYLALHEPSRYSMLRTSIVPTMMKAGVGANVIPSEAEATLDIRALPDEDITKFFDEMKKVINDPAVRIEPITGNLRPTAPPSRLDTDMYKAIEKVSKEMYPGVVVLPTMSTGASDMAQLRAKGIPSYGIGPAASEQDSAQYGAHGDVERLLESSVYRFVEFTWRVVMSVAN